MELEAIKAVHIDGSALKVTILLPYFNEKIGMELLENTTETLKEHGVKEEHITLKRTAGALELPFAAQNTIKTTHPDVIIALGAVIRGETGHYDLVVNETYRGLMEVQLREEVPIIFGVLTCETLAQAHTRARADGLNKGRHSAIAALIQATL